MKRLTVLFLIAAILLPSCGIYNRYERPELDVRADSTALPSWRSVFADAALQALIDTALAHNTDLQVALLRTEEARASLQAARLSFLPSLSLSGSTAPPSSGSSLDTASGSPWAWSLGAQSSWELDLFARKLNARRSAEAVLEGREAYGRLVRTALIASVAEAYYTLLKLDAQLDISEQTLLSWDKSISVLESLKMAGKTNDVAVLQAKAKKMNLEASSVSIRGSIDKAQQALCVLLGVTDRPVTRGRLADASISVFPEGIPVSAVAGRPDVAQAEAALKQAFYTTQAARSAFYPDLTLSGSLGWTDGRGGVSDPASWIWNALGSLTAPVFARGTRKAALRSAQASQEAAKLQFRQALLDAGREVNDALTSCQTARERMEIDLRQQEALKGAVEKIELMMRYSTTNYLEVLTAQQSFLDAELKVVEDRYALIQGNVALYRALGGGAE